MGRTNSLSSQRRPKILTTDPLQDLVVIVSSPGAVAVTGTEQNHHTFWVEYWSASFQRPCPDTVCASLECKHTFDVPGSYDAELIGEPAIVYLCSITYGMVVILLPCSSKSWIGGDL